MLGNKSPNIFLICYLRSGNKNGVFRYLVKNNIGYFVSLVSHRHKLSFWILNWCICSFEYITPIKLSFSIWFMLKPLCYAMFVISFILHDLEDDFLKNTIHFFIDSQKMIFRSLKWILHVVFEIKLILTLKL